MNIVKVKLKRKQLENRCVLIRVRVKGIIEQLNLSTSLTEFPVPLKNFLEILTSNKTYFPKDFLPPFIKNKLKFDNYDATE
jgi:hypothetical protein